MTSVEQAKVILDPKRLKLPEKPRVDAIEVEDMVALDGEDALRVQVIIADDTTDDEITGEAVIEIKSAIRDALRAKGIREFAVIYFAKPSELEELKNAE